MDNNKVEKLWDGNVGPANPPLRRPNLNPTQPTNQNNRQNNLGHQQHTFQNVPFNIQQNVHQNIQQNVHHDIQNVAHNIQNVAHTIQNVPHNIQNVPHSLQNVPYSIQNVPHSIQNVPHTIQNVPLTIQNIPHSIQNVHNIQNVHSIQQNVPLNYHNIQQNVQDNHVIESEGPDSGENVDLTILSKSTLSAEAKEWFPSNYGTPTVAISSAQSRLARIRLGDSPAVPQVYNNVQQQNSYNTDTDTTRLNEMICTLTYDPGRFDDVVDNFLSIMQSYADNVEICNTVADMLFNTALHEPNFRYNSARLCSLLQDCCPLVRSRLHILCEKELQALTEKQGLTLFLAELYTQLHYENLYGKSLFHALRNLLSDGGPENVKCVCQALKLCGFSLDRYDKPVMDDIFSQLDVLRRNLPTRVLNLLESVISLRSRGWDQSSPVPSSSGTPFAPQPINGYANNGAHGQPGVPGVFFNNSELSVEESEFLASCEEYSDYFVDEFDPDELCDPEPEMDEEIQEAFREFVQMSKR